MPETKIADRRLLCSCLTRFLQAAAMVLLAVPIASAVPAGTFVWNADWIAAPQSETRSLPIFRREFQVPERPVKATLRISGLGHFEAHINGHTVTEDVLTPAWTAYRKRVFYDTYDVTRLLRAGPNAIGVLLGNGMYNVEQTAGRYTKFSGTFGQPKLILQLEISFADGTQQMIVSGKGWKTAPGPIVFTSIYGGEDYDARLEQASWDKPGLHDSAWSAVSIVDGPGGRLVPEAVQPVRVFQAHPAAKVTRPAPGITVYDLGQNFAGWPAIAVTGARGAHVKLIPGELLDPFGRVTQCSAYAFPDSENSFNYTLKGSGIERWTPRFSYYGFRYVELRVTDGSATVVHLQGRSIHDAVAQAGHFTSSDPQFNRIHQLIDRAMLSNMVSVLTDCPHREKLGWLEQTHLAGASLMYNYDLAALYNKISDDIADSQLDNGLVPDIAPEYSVFDGPFRDSPEWGAAVVLGPWTAYQFSGNPEILFTHYDSMRRYLAYLHGRLQDGLLTYGLGDWYDIGPGDPGESKLTTKGLTATAIYFQMLTTTSRIAKILSRDEDAARYMAESESIKRAFNDRFFHPESGSYDTGSQTANAMPLAIGLVPEASRPAVLASLVADIRKHSDHVTAGDIGFHYVVRALTDNGRSDVLYDMLSRTDKPSYGDQLAHGATTLTEAWDANPNSSQNHFMLGHAEEWFYRGLAGIDFDRTRDADTQIRLQPAIVGHMRSASATFQSSLGLIESSWTRLQTRTGGTLEWNVSVPKGSTATVVFPTAHLEAVQINGRRLTRSGPVRGIRVEGGKTVSVVAPGRYRFTVAL